MLHGQKPQQYVLPPTTLVPNSPLPLLHYQAAFDPASSEAAVEIYRHFADNEWETQWVYRYGPTQQSHYHSAAHEVMAVLSGTATIEFGAGDLPGGDEVEAGGITIAAQAGDIFVLPAGTAHKTHDTRPSAEFALLTPGDGHRIVSDEVADADVARQRTEQALAEMRLDGFVMLGAYPRHSQWNFCVAGEDSGDFERIWSVDLPGLDPLLGNSEDGLCKLWRLC